MSDDKVITNEKIMRNNHVSGIVEEYKDYITAMNANKKYKNVELKLYSVIKITRRKVSDRVQPEVKLNEKYAVVATDRLASGCPVAIVSHPARKGKTMRINADRFEWHEVHADEIISDVRKINKQMDVDDTMDKLKCHYTDDEINRLLFIPYCIEFMALEYLDRCIRYARDNRMSCFLKVGRLAKDVLAKVRDDKIRELGDVAYEDLRNDALSFMKEYTMDFTRLWFTINNELKRIKAPERHLDLVSDAVAGVLLMDVLDEYQEERKQKVLPVIGNTVFCCYEKRKNAIRSILKTYAALIDGRTAEPLNLDAYNLQLARRIIINKLNEVTFLEKMRQPA